MSAGAARVGPSVGIDDCRILDFPVIGSDSGNLTFVEAPADPVRHRAGLLSVRRARRRRRGGHAHRTLHQLLVAMSGSFDVVVDDGAERRSASSLNRSYHGLYLPPMIWRELDNFSSGSVCMVLASDHYDEGDYYRDYDEFLTAPGSRAAMSGSRFLDLDAPARRARRPSWTRPTQRVLDGRAGTYSAPSSRPSRRSSRRYCGAAHCVGVGNGLDALTLGACRRAGHRRPATR